MQIDIDDLYKTYYTDLYKYVYVSTLNKYDTEDIVQNTFIKAIKGITRFRGDSSIKTWLFKIAHNECVNYYHKNPKNLDLDTVAIVMNDNLEKQFCEKEDVKRILDFIQFENEPIKSLLVLRLVDEHSFAEIASILDKTEVWCRVTFFRVKKKMLDVLEGGNYGK